MDDDSIEELMMARWPGDWPGRLHVDLDNVGDPGEWISTQIPSAREVLFEDEDDEQMAAELAHAYIAAADESYFPLPTEFGTTEEVMIEMFTQEFVGFLEEWRTKCSDLGERP